MAAQSFRTSKDTDLRNEDFYGFVNDATFLSLAGERAREFCSDRLWRAEAAEGENKTTDTRNKTLISVPCKTNPSPSLLRLLGPSIPLFFFFFFGFLEDGKTSHLIKFGVFSESIGLEENWFLLLLCELGKMASWRSASCFSETSLDGDSEEDSD